MELTRWNRLAMGEAEETLLSCCGSRVWAAAVAGRRPFGSVGELLVEAEMTWFALPEAEWMAAFACHPRIGESKAGQQTSAQYVEWSRQEQGSARASLDAVTEELAAGNRAYEARFGFVYLVFASGRTAAELLEILHERLMHDRATEVLEAARQQWRITKMRMGKWLGVANERDFYTCAGYVGG